VARPIKKGLDYFPLDTDMDLDDKIVLIEARHGMVGFAIIVKLLMKIYGIGYFYEWNEEKLLLFCNRAGGDAEMIEAVVADALKWGVFDKKLYDKYGILTSAGIQDRYFRAIYKRATITITKEYKLIDLAKYPKLEAVSVESVEKKKPKAEKKKPTEKVKYHDEIYLTSEEYDRLVADFGKRITDAEILDADAYLSQGNNRKNYSDHNKMIRTWLRRKGIDRVQDSLVKPKAETPEVVVDIKYKLLSEVHPDWDEEIKDDVNAQSYDSWFKSIYVVKENKEKILLFVTDDYQVQWLHEHYEDVMKKCIKKLFKFTSEIGE